MQDDGKSEDKLLSQISVSPYDIEESSDQSGSVHRSENEKKPGQDKNQKNKWKLNGAFAWLLLAVLVIGLVSFLYANATSFQFMPNIRQDISEIISPSSQSVTQRSSAPSSYSKMGNTGTADVNQSLLKLDTLIKIEVAAPIVTAICAVIGLIMMFGALVHLGGLRRDVQDIADKLYDKQVHKK